jgi:hypothetical protein
MNSNKTEKPLRKTMRTKYQNKSAELTGFEITPAAPQINLIDYKKGKRVAVYSRHKPKEDDVHFDFEEITKYYAVLESQNKSKTLR